MHPTDESLRVSFGVLNLTHRDSHAEPTPLVPGQRYQVRIQLNDAGSTFPAGHRIRLALSTNYFPMVWPAPEPATLTILGGALELPVRPARSESLRPLPAPESAPPDGAEGRPRQIRPGVMRFDRIGLEVGNEWKFSNDLTGDDPLSAVAEMSRITTISRESWKVRIEATMRMSCAREAFRLQASIRAFDGTTEVCHRTWDESIKRDLV